MDLFSGRAGLEAFAVEGRSLELTAFKAKLEGHKVWAFPPRKLVKATLVFLNGELESPQNRRVFFVFCDWCAFAVFCP